jgi:hypothetical protein
VYLAPFSGTLVDQMLVAGSALKGAITPRRLFARSHHPSDDYSLIKNRRTIGISEVKARTTRNPYEAKIFGKIELFQPFAMLS